VRVLSPLSDSAYEDDSLPQRKVPIMARHRKPAWIAVISSLVLLSCASSYKEMFLNRTHRVNLSLEDEELKNLQFYISTSVLVQYDGPSGQQSILLPEETPGVVTAVGPDWLKVSFRERGADVPFVVDLRSQNDFYYVATELPGQAGFHMIKDLPQKVFHYNGTPYRVIYGDRARLLVDGKGLQKLREKRVPTKGRRTSAIHEPSDSSARH
jgi:hypothetical protein